MAWLETIQLTRFEVRASESGVTRAVIEDLDQPDFPQLCWESGYPWREANQWLLTRLEDDRNIATVNSDARCLHAYAQWLEQAGIDWLDFPIRKRDRCLVRYRGSLRHAMDSNQLKPSTAALRMRVVLRFYRWLRDVGLLSSDTPLWTEKAFLIHRFDEVGFTRTIEGTTTDLAIPNKPAGKIRLEGGVEPLSASERDKILTYARDLASEELNLMLHLGFFTGMRLGTICDLKLDTIFLAAEAALTDKLHHLAIGPGARPAVHTKFGVTGQIVIPTSLLEWVRDYATSPRRQKRQVLAKQEHRDLVFLTRYGNPYTAKRGQDKSSSINVELHRLKQTIAKVDPQLESFKFHQTRATFATQVALFAAKKLDAVAAIALVQDLLLHADESTSEEYIRFNERSELKAEVSNEFSRLLMGVIDQRSPIHEH
jgi:integrase